MGAFTNGEGSGQKLPLDFANPPLKEVLSAS
jgi:hypothetical protein